MKLLHVVALIAWMAACLIALCAGAVTLVFKRPDVSAFDPAGGTLKILRDPDAVIQKPYGRVVRILTIASWGVGLFALVCVVLGSL